MAPGSTGGFATARVAQAVLGAASGLALWSLTRFWPDPALSAPTYLFLFVLIPTHAGVALALTGPLPPRRALAGALRLSLPVAGLATLAGRRYADATDLLDDPVMFGVLAVLTLVAVPFLSVRIGVPQDWLRYGALFRTAWAINVRFLAAWALVALFWGLAVLSIVLLNLVGLGGLADALALGWVRFTLTGAVLGLGLAVAYELRDTLAPFLVLRLLRLMVPPVLAVVAVFLAAVPFRGLSQLFGEFSAAATLMATTMAAITLVSAALDCDDAGAVATPVLRAATRALAVLLAFVSALALLAVAIRVRQYGWTPDRLLAFGVASVLAAYGIGYAGAALAGRNWAAHLRAVNTAMALAVIGACALWMTPGLDALRISSASQIARYTSGRAQPGDLPLWEMAHRWGLAGQRGIERLAERGGAAGDSEMAELLVAARRQTDPFRFRRAVEDRRVPQDAAELARLLAVRPAGAEGLGAAALAGVPSFSRDAWIAGCRRALPDGRAGCVLVRGAFAPVPGARGQGMVLYLDTAGAVRGDHVLIGAEGAVSVRALYDPVADRWPILPAEAIAQVLDGAFSIGPSGVQGLGIGDFVLVPGN